jgi:exopolysaccharide biosynthesis polyprenyl glycosylphosphotransferase
MTKSNGRTGKERPPAIRKEVLLGCADLLAFLGSSVLAVYIRFGAHPPDEHLLPYFLCAPGLLLIRLVAAYAVGLYDFRHRLTLIDHGFAAAGAAFWAVAAGYVMVALLRLYYFPLIRVSRLVAVIDMGLLVLWFILSRGAVLALLEAGGYRLRVLLAGAPDECRRLAAEIREHAPKLLEVDARGGISPRLMEAHGPYDRVILVEADLPQGELRDLLGACDRSATEVYFVPGLTLATLASSRVTSLAGIPLAPLQPVFGSGLYRIFKRLMDVAVSLLLLVATLPITVAAWAAVKVASPGPAFFRQERVGLRGKQFRIIKFRTMVLNAEEGSGPALSTADDPRVTPVGRLLRRLRIDEIPQLLNVLQGEMSLVGPRPERPAFTAQFIAENPLYERRHLVKPGLTGLAQIHGRYDSSYKHKLRYDLIYINSMSFAADMRILVATIQTVLTGRGAV